MQVTFKNLTESYIGILNLTYSLLHFKHGRHLIQRQGILGNRNEDQTGDLIS